MFWTQTFPLLLFENDEEPPSWLGRGALCPKPRVHAEAGSRVVLGERSAMASLEDWKMPAALQPKPHDYAYDLDQALLSVVGLSSQVPADAFTAEILGTERAGNGVLIRDDRLVLTIGYLVTEAEEVWLTTNAGRVVPGHVLAYDQVTGFGLVQALARLDIPVLPIGDSSRAPVGEHVIVAGAGGRARSVAARIVARQEFAGYWEYLLDEAIFTAPGPPALGRHGLDRLWRRAVGDRLAPAPTRHPARRDLAAQHDCSH